MLSAFNGATGVTDAAGLTGAAGATGAAGFTGVVILGDAPKESPLFVGITFCAPVTFASRPVAITVMLHSSVYVSSYIAPKIMFASSPAISCT